jgi:hypothetical protein
VCFKCCEAMMQEMTEAGCGFAFSDLMEDLMWRADVSVTLVAAVWMRENFEMATGNRRWN